MDMEKINLINIVLIKLHVGVILDFYTKNKQYK